MPRHNQKNTKFVKKNNFKGNRKPHFGGKHEKRTEIKGDRRSKNFKFIRRGKETMETMRTQREVEMRYKEKANESNQAMNMDMYAAYMMDQEPGQEAEQEELAFDSLLAKFQNKGNRGRFDVTVESSSDDEDEEEEEEVEDEEDDEDLSDLDEEDFEEELEGEEEEDDDADLDAVDVGGVDSADEVEEEDGEEDEDVGTEEEDDEDNEHDNKLKSDDDSEHGSDALTKNKTKNNNSTVTPTTDMFNMHLKHDLSPEHIKNLLNKPVINKNSTLHWPTLGKLQLNISSACAKAVQAHKKSKILLTDDEIYASEGVEPNKQSQDNINASLAVQLQAHNAKRELTPLQSELYSLLNNYQDVFYPQETQENNAELREIYCLHVLNHMLKTRARILRNNSKLAAAAAVATANAKEKKKSKAKTPIQPNLNPELLRDQGLVRPKVLILLPFRSAALQVVNIMTRLLYGVDGAETAKTNGSITNYTRFSDEYGGHTIYFPTTNPKPDDYEKTFAGNTDDNFKIGLSLTKKCLKLYTEFYASDIIIASPLGLRTIIGAPGDAERDFDFLNSIELLILDQSEIFLAQNWDHILHIVEHMHLQPATLRDADVTRVRGWCLNGLSRFYRQSLIFASHELPELRALFYNKCCNYRGKLHISNAIVNGSIQQVLLPTPQIFHKIDANSFQSTFDQRFEYFVREVLPKYKNASMAHCMLYVPSYFDYVRLRNYFKSESINFVQICEYTEDRKIARARDIFYHSGAPFMLYSERSHFFRRTRIKGIRHLIMYQPPMWPHFYAEMIQLMQDANQNAKDGLAGAMSITVLYTKYDVCQLNGIVGSERAAKLIQSRNLTHVFRST